MAGSLDSKSLNILLLLFAKMERHNVLTNYSIEICSQLLDTWYMQCWWIGSWASTKFCILPSLVISLDFGIWNKQFQENLIFLKNNLIPTEPEKGTTIYMIRWVPQALQKDCLPYASRHADGTCMQWQWNSFFSS